MAISKDIVVRGVSIPGAYIRIGQFVGDKATVGYEVQFCAAKGSPVFDTQRQVFTHQLSGASILEQAYAHLKSLPEFASATDC